MRSLRFILIGLPLIAAASATSAQGQQPSQLPRVAPTTGLADSSLYICTDSTKVNTRACKFSDIQKRLAFKAWDSLVTTSKLRITGATVVGAGTWSNAQTFAAGQLVDSTTGAARSQKLTTARTIGGVSFDGSANILPDSAVGAARASALVGSPAITVSSCTGCGGGAADSIRLKNGAAATPSLMFTNSLTTGLYRFGADTMGLASTGRMAGYVVDSAFRMVKGRTGRPSYGFVENATTGMYFRTGTNCNGTTGNQLLIQAVGNPIIIDSACTTISGTFFRNSQMQGGDGSATTPSISFANQTGHGFYNIGSTSFGVAVGGSINATFSSTFFIPVKPIAATSGTAGGPSYSFNNSSTTGFYRFGADTIGISTAGVASLGIRGGATPTIFGGAGNMTIQAGTGNSRTMTLQTTTSAGAVKNSVVLGADSAATFIGQVRAAPGNSMGVGNGNSHLYFSASFDTIGFVFSGSRSVDVNTSGIKMQGTSVIRALNGSASTPAYTFTSFSGGLSGMYRIGTDSLAFGTGGVQSLIIGGGATTKLSGGAGNMTITSGTGNARTMTLQTTNSTGVATSFASGSGDTLLLAAHAIATGLTTAAGTPGTICYNTTTSELTKNAATSCVVSSRRFKKDIEPLSLGSAKSIVAALRPVTFTYRSGERKAIGLIAEEADSIDSRLSFRDAKGLVNSVAYEEVTILLLKVVQQQQKTIDSLVAAGKKKP